MYIVVYCSFNHQSTSREMLNILSEKATHQQCIDHPLIEVYKFLNGKSPAIINDVLHLRHDTYNLQNFHASASDVFIRKYLLNSVVTEQINHEKLCLLTGKTHPR